MLPFDNCKKKLALLWFVAAGLLFALMLVQTFADKHGDAAGEVWNWLLGAVVPTLSLMLGAFVADFDKPQDDRRVGSFLYRLTFGLSLFYLFAVALVFIAQPATGKPVIALVKQSSAYLTALQGLVAAALGVFFVKK